MHVDFNIIDSKAKALVYNYSFYVNIIYSLFSSRVSYRFTLTVLSVRIAPKKLYAILNDFTSFILKNNSLKIKEK